MASSNVTRWKRIAEEAGKQYGVSPALLLAQIEQESGGTPINRSSAGAEGLSQFIPSTAAHYGVKFGSGAAETRSQIFGQAAYLKALGVQSNPKGALESYLGGGPEGPKYAASILGKVKEYEDAEPSALETALNILNPTNWEPFKGTKLETGLLGKKGPLGTELKLGEFLEALTNPQTWLRVAEGIGGATLFLVGLKTLTRGSGGGALQEGARQTRAVRGIGVKAGRVVAGVAK